MKNKIIKILEKPKIIIPITFTISLLIGVLVFMFAGRAPEITVDYKNTDNSFLSNGSLQNFKDGEDISLAFPKSGRISNVFVKSGDSVKKGQILAELASIDAKGAVSQASGALDIAKANYEKILNGATGADIDVLKAAVSKAQNNLDKTTSTQETLVKNAYFNLLNSTPEATPKNGTSDYVAPIISGNYNLGKEGTINLTSYYSQGGTAFTTTGLVDGSGTGNAIISQPIGNSGLYIKFPSTTNINVNDWIIEIPNKKASNYLTNLNAYQLALETRNKAIYDAEASVGDTGSSSIADAQIIQAQSSIDSISARISNSKIVAPISGVVTQFDAKVGQLASQNTSLISIMSSGGYEVDSGVSETDIGKISVGNKVSMTLDAFPNETFIGSVFYIAPAETNTAGVISYQVKISFDKMDSRLKSGLTANINIQTKHKDNILILPQYAILQNDIGTFIETVDEKGKITQSPIQLGITDQKGNVEIISGVTQGEQVLNIGLKKN